MIILDRWNLLCLYFVIRMGDMEELKDSLTCPVCMEYFRLPYSLPCGHSLCHVCAPLSKDCPLCRGPVNTWPLPRNFSLLSVIKAAKNAKILETESKDVGPLKTIHVRVGANSFRMKLYENRLYSIPQFIDEARNQTRCCIPVLSPEMWTRRFGSKYKPAASWFLDWEKVNCYMTEDCMIYIHLDHRRTLDEDPNEKQYGSCEGIIGCARRNHQGMWVYTQEGHTTRGFLRSIRMTYFFSDCDEL